MLKKLGWHLGDSGFAEEDGQRMGVLLACRGEWGLDGEFTNPEVLVYRDSGAVKLTALHDILRRYSKELKRQLWTIRQ